MKKIIFLFLLMLGQATAYAGIRTEAIDYKHGDKVLQGYLAYDESISGKRPAVIIVHDWKGLNDYAKKRANQIASLGYAAFAIDIYGKEIRPNTNEEARTQSDLYKKDRKLVRERAAASLEAIQNNPRVDTSRIAAIGYCFGGMTVLEMARSGADLKGVVSFHGDLNTPNPEDAKNIKGKVLVLHGAEDPYVPAKDVQALEDEMRGAKVDWQVVLYGGAVHSFTNPSAGNDPSKGAAYNESADKRSWQAMELFLKEVFA